MIRRRPSYRGENHLKPSRKYDVFDSDVKSTPGFGEDLKVFRRIYKGLSNPQRDSLAYLNHTEITHLAQANINLPTINACQAHIWSSYFTDGRAP